MGAPPSDPVVYEASAETKAEVGIAKWGFANDAATGTSVFHGYGAQNDLLVEVRQTLDTSDPKNVHFTMSMSGVKATGSEKIDFTARPTADGKNTELSINVLENTFDEGTIGARVLAHVGADAKAKDSTVTSGSGSLTGKSRPLDNQLVTPCSATTNRCENELIDSRIAAGSAAGDCSLLKRYGLPLVSTIGGALVGGFFTLETGPGAIVGAAAGGAAGAVAFPIAGVTCIASQQDAATKAAELRACRSQPAAACTP